MPPEAVRSELQRTVDEITGYRRRTRAIRILLGVVAVIALAAGVIALLIAIGNKHQNSAIARETAAIHQQTIALHQSELTFCEITNDSRARAEQLWLSFLKLLTPAHPTTAQRDALDQFEAKFLPDLHTEYTQLDCSKLYRSS